MSINYAQYQEIQSLPAAIVFAAVYVPLFALNAIQSARIKSRVYLILSFFCLLRIVAFSLRAALAGSASAAHNQSLLIAEEVFYNVGFFGILSSAYTLCLDRQILAEIDRTVEQLPGLIEETNGSTQNDIEVGQKLRHASTIIFLVVVVFLVIQTMLLAYSSAFPPPNGDGEPGSPFYPDGVPVYIGTTNMKSFIRGETRLRTMHGSLILATMSALLLVREAFLAATYNNLSKQDQETLWYPLVAGTELLAVILFITPGLVPPHDDRLPPRATGGIIGLVMRGSEAGSHDV
ncbi:hypothetical protein B0H21DRAFT_839751 [Amylocystis lapponica]|nr:hypothetical protein B0H21DRAFT_839751 [Amylocystis lapponica]